MTTAISTPNTTANRGDLDHQAAPTTAATARRIYNPLQKDAATFLTTTEEANGAYSLIELEVAPGGGNMLHYHKTFAEHFTPLSGELGVQVGKQVSIIKPGETTVAPVMSLHRWYNPGQETILVRVELRPGNIGFERALHIAYGLVRDGRANKQGLPKSLIHMALLAEMSDTNVPGVLTAIAPLLRMLASWARRRGIERELVERYCY